MSSTRSDLPGPPSSEGSSPTQIAGQQVVPSSTVPPSPAGALYTPAAETKTNTLAVVSLVTAIASFFGNVVPILGGTVLGLIAVITGYMARKQIKETGERGMGLAIAGMIIGIAHLGLLIITVIALFFLIFVMGIALFGSARR